MKNLIKVFISLLILLSLSCNKQEIVSNQVQAKLSPNSIIIYQFTQLGYEEYMAEYHNDKYFLQFRKKYNTNGQMDSLTSSLDSLKAYIQDNKPYNKEFTWAFGVLVDTVLKNKDGAIYCYPKPEVQGVISKLDKSLESTIYKWGIQNGLDSSNINILRDGNEESYDRISIQL